MMEALEKDPIFGFKKFLLYFVTGVNFLGGIVTLFLLIHGGYNEYLEYLFNIEGTVINELIETIRSSIKSVSEGSNKGGIIIILSIIISIGWSGGFCHYWAWLKTGKKENIDSANEMLYKTTWFVILNNIFLLSYPFELLSWGLSMMWCSMVVYAYISVRKIKDSISSE